MRKPVFCICKNKGADQLHDNRAADQRLCIHYKDSTIPLLPKSKISILCHCTAQFLPDLVKKTKDRFCRDVAHLLLSLILLAFLSIFCPSWSSTGIFALFLLPHFYSNLLVILYSETQILYQNYYLSCTMTKTTMWFVCPEKALIGLSIL